MKRLASLFSSALVAALVPALASAGSTCDNYCGKIDADAKAALANPSCAKNAACVQCVKNAQLSSQSGIQCSAANVSKKGKGLEVGFATLNTAATLVCGTACTISLIPGYGTASERAWSQACGWSGLAVTVAEVGQTVANIIKGGDVDYMSLATTALGAKSTIAMTSKAGAEAAAKITTNAVGKSTGKINSTACLNAIMYGVAAAAKIKSIKKSNDSMNGACANALQFADAGSPIQSCLGPTGPTKITTQSTSLSGSFAATAEVFISKPSIDDVNHLAATSALNDGLKNLKKDMEMAASSGKLNYDDIANKLDSGADLSSVLAGANLDPGLMSSLKKAEDAVKNGDTTKLASLMGQGGGAPGYSAPAAVASTGGDSGIGDLSFGMGASPGEGAESLEIDRAPAGAKAGALADDGDIFHGAFGGTIFDIVTTRLKAEKSNYAELDPEGRMNRLFNGYGEPGAKKARKPAGTSNR